MAKRCKHQNGRLIEFMDATHDRLVRNGELAEKGHNEIGNITGYEYHCFDCDRYFRFIAKPKQQWLTRIHEQL